MPGSRPRAVVVTGASHGLGRAVAEAFALDGDRVYLLDKDEEAGTAVVRGLAERGCDATFVRADVAEDESVRRAFAEIATGTEAVSILVNNAGGGPRAPIENMSPAEWRAVLELNLSSVFYCTQAALGALRRAEGASVVNLASFHAFATVKGMAAYAAAKGGVVSLTRSLALELAPEVRVNAIAPGLVETEGWRASVGDVEAARRHRLPYHPLGRLGVPDDVVGAVKFLAGSDAGFLTGITLPVAGGLGLALYP